MADGADQGDRTFRRGADDDLFVEGPEVLDRAAAARDDQQIGPGRERGKTANRSRDLFGSAFALDRNRPDDDVARAAIGETVEDIANDRTGWRRDDSDRGREVGKRPLAAFVEQPLSGERTAAPVEQRHQRALTRQLEPVDDDLVFRAPRVGGELAGGDHFRTVFRSKGQAPGLAAPKHGIDTGGIVLQREIAMTRSMALPPGDLAADPDVAECLLNRALERARQFAHAERRRIVAGADLR